MNNPKITVLMPVYNEEKHIKKSVNSILKQTYENFEFLIINDASKDNTLSILNSYSDPRIKIINNKKNWGITRSLNIGLKKANGKYIARMDADDISFPKRLEEQFVFMENNTNVGVCGSWVKTFGNKELTWKYPINSKKIKCQLLFNCNVIAHPSVIIRKAIIERYNLRYNQKLAYAQDWYLWQKISHYTRLVNIPKFLLKYRITKKNSKKRQSSLYFKNIRTIVRNNITSLEIKPSEKEINLHLELGSHVQIKSESKEIEKWLLKLLNKNKTIKYFPPNYFKLIIIKRYLNYLKIKNTKLFAYFKLLKNPFYRKWIFL